LQSTSSSISRVGASRKTIFRRGVVRVFKAWGAVDGCVKGSTRVVELWELGPEAYGAHDRFATAGHQVAIAQLGAGAFDAVENTCRLDPLSSTRSRQPGDLFRAA
jgi:hypothetical protein